MFLFGCRFCITCHAAFPKSVIYIIVSHFQTWYLHDGIVSLIGVIETPTTSMPWSPLNSRISSVFHRPWFIIFNPNQRRWIEYTRLSWWHFIMTLEMAWRPRPLQLVLSGGPVPPTPHNRIQWEYNELRGENRGPFKGNRLQDQIP